MKKSLLAERLWLVVLAVSLAFHPAFALRVSCSAVGALFPSHCCCASKVAAPEAPRSCCAERERARDDGAPSVRPSQSCRCAIDLPDREPAAPDTLARVSFSRDLELGALAAACASGDATRAFELVVEHDPPRGDCDPPPRGSSDRSMHLVASGMLAHLARLGVARC